MRVQSSKRIADNRYTFVLLEKAVIHTAWPAVVLDWLMKVRPAQGIQWLPAYSVCTFERTTNPRLGVPMGNLAYIQRGPNWIYSVRALLMTLGHVEQPCIYTVLSGRMITIISKLFDSMWRQFVAYRSR